MILDGPIPGQSLTKTPRNALYERPPEIADPNEAVLYHMQRLSDPERLDNLLYTLEYGLPIKHATQAALDKICRLPPGGQASKVRRNVAGQKSAAITPEIRIKLKEHWQGRITSSLGFEDYASFRSALLQHNGF